MQQQQAQMQATMQQQQIAQMTMQQLLGGHGHPPQPPPPQPQWQPAQPPQQPQAQWQPPPPPQPPQPPQPQWQPLQQQQHVVAHGLAEWNVGAAQEWPSGSVLFLAAARLVNRLVNLRNSSTRSSNHSRRSARSSGSYHARAAAPQLRRQCRRSRPCRRRLPRHCRRACRSRRSANCSRRSHCAQLPPPQTPLDVSDPSYEVSDPTDDASGVNSAAEETGGGGGGSHSWAAKTRGGEGGALSEAANANAPTATAVAMAMPILEGESAAEAEARQLEDAIRASLNQAEEEASRPLFDESTADVEFVRSLNAEIAAQGFAEAEAAFAERLEHEGFSILKVPRDGDCAFRCAQLWRALETIVNTPNGLSEGSAEFTALVAEFADWDKRNATSSPSNRDGSSPPGGGAKKGHVSSRAASGEWPRAESPDEVPPQPPPPSQQHSRPDAPHHALRRQAVEMLRKRMGVPNDHTAERIDAICADARRGGTDGTSESCASGFLPLSPRMPARV